MTDASALQRKRQRRDRLFRRAGQASVLLAAGFLFFLLFTIVSNGWQAFRQTHILVPISFGTQFAGATPETVRQANYRRLLQQGLAEVTPPAPGRRAKAETFKILSITAPDVVRQWAMKDPARATGTVNLWLPTSDDVDQFRKRGHGNHALSATQKQALMHLQEQDRLKFRFNTGFFLNADSREPEAAGILGGLIGSLLTLAVTLLLAFPVGVAAAIYLEEFAPNNRWKDLIEVNINNLAAVPSIIYGLLGLAVFLTFFNLPRSTPVVGGLVLGLMTLPIIIIATRAALKAVPDSIRQAAMGMGASPVQTVFHHVLPAAMPGILTGTIIGMAHALGETAPLILIGMVAFIADAPQGLFDAATVLPVQIYIWAESPERGFVEKTSAAILMLMVFLMAMNALAIWLRRRLEIKW